MNDYLQGYGLLTGRPITVEGNTYYLMAVDQDGPSAISQIAELSSRTPLPKTVAFASGRSGRCQYLFLVPERYRDSLKTKKIKTGVIGDDGKGEQLELSVALPSDTEIKVLGRGTSQEKG